MRLGFGPGFIAVMLVTCPGSGRCTPTQSPSDRRFAERTMQDYARCALGWNSRQRLDHFLALNPFSQGADRIGSTIAPSACLHMAGQMSFGASLYRAALYDALYRREFAATTLLPTHDQPALNIASEVVSDVASQAQVFLAERAFGDCVSRLAPASVRTLVLTNIDSKDEVAAYVTLNEPMGECLAPGQTLRLSRPMLRGILAEGLYKLSLAAKSTGEGGATAGGTATAKP